MLSPRVGLSIPCPRGAPSPEHPDRSVCTQSSLGGPLLAPSHYVRLLVVSGSQAGDPEGLIASPGPSREAWGAQTT